jgi:hypothetical protein
VDSLIGSRTIRRAMPRVSIVVATMMLALAGCAVSRDAGAEAREPDDAAREPHAAAREPHAAAREPHAAARELLVAANALPRDGSSSDEPRLVALVFISPECPIANAMVPDLIAAAQEARRLGIAFCAVHPTPWADDAALRAHAREFEIDGVLPIVADRALALAELAGATVTPEAALLRFDGEGGVERLYVGRVNDLYSAIGRRRAVATSNDLVDAMRAARRGAPIANPAPKAIGCFIARPS